MRTFLTSLMVLMTLFSACKQSQGASSIDIERLSSVYAELLVLNERFDLSKDSLSNQKYVTMYREILQKHRMTKDEYASQFEAVTTAPEMYRQLCDRALTKLQQMRGMPDTTGMRVRS